MKRILDVSEILGVVQTPSGPRELCVRSDASYDEDRARLTVKLDAFLRDNRIAAKENHDDADWLPKPQVLQEFAAPGETGELARDIFLGWVRKVRNVAPTLAKS